MIGHGNGPQVGLLALQGAAYHRRRDLPARRARRRDRRHDRLHDRAGAGQPAALRAAVRHAADDDRGRPGRTRPSRNPTKFIGPVYDKADAERLAAEKGWAIKPDGDKWRRVVASPEPKRIFELRPMKWLLEKHTIVIAAGGGGIPTTYDPKAERKLVGVECVIDKDLASELLARELDADLFVMLTDADAVYVDWGKPTQRAIRRASPDALAAMTLRRRLDGARRSRRPAASRAPPASVPPSVSCRSSPRFLPVPQVRRSMPAQTASSTAEAFRSRAPCHPSAPSPVGHVCAYLTTPCAAPDRADAVRGRRRPHHG